MSSASDTPTTDGEEKVLGAEYTFQDVSCDDDGGACASGDVNQLNAQVDAILARKVKLEGLVRDLEEKVSAARKERLDLDGARANLEQGNARLKEEHAALEQETESLRRELQQLKRVRKHYEDSVKDVSAKLSAGASADAQTSNKPWRLDERGRSIDENGRVRRLPSGIIIKGPRPDGVWAEHAAKERRAREDDAKKAAAKEDTEDKDTEGSDTEGSDTEGSDTEGGHGDGDEVTSETEGGEGGDGDEGTTETDGGEGDDGGDDADGDDGDADGDDGDAAGGTG